MYKDSDIAGFIKSISVTFESAMNSAKKLIKLLTPVRLLGLCFFGVALAAIYWKYEFNWEAMQKDFFANIVTEMLSVVFTVIVLDVLNERRIANQEKRTLVMQMGSPDNAYALQAVQLLRARGWLTDGSLREIELIKANLQNAHLRLARLPKADLSEADLRGIHLRGANLRKANLSWANLQKADLFGADLAKAVMEEANLENACLAMAILQDADLRLANLQGANLDSAKLQGIDLHQANLQEAHFFVAKLQAVDLYGANLVKAYLAGAKLQQADLLAANISLACLLRANLSAANMYQALLVGSILDGAKLTRVNLRGADLRDAGLRQADLTGADLRGAMMMFTRLDGARLAGANLEGAKYLTADQLQQCGTLEGAVLPDGSSLPRRAKATDPEPDWKAPLDQYCQLLLGSEWDQAIDSFHRNDSNTKQPEDVAPSKMYYDLGGQLCEEDANRIKYLGNMHLGLAEYVEAWKTYRFALDLYRQIGSQPGEARCVESLGDVYTRLREFQKAKEMYDQALAIYREIGNRLGESNCLKGLGDVRQLAGEQREAKEIYGAALSIYREIGDQLGEANCFRNLGDVHLRGEEYGEARKKYEQARSIYRKIENRLGEANCISGLGDVSAMMGADELAKKKFKQALSVYGEINNQIGMAECSEKLSVILKYSSEYEEYRKTYEQALFIYQEIGNRPGEARCSKALGNAHHMVGEYEEAKKMYVKAIELFDQTKDADEAAYTLSLLAQLLAQMGETEAAIEQAKSCTNRYSNLAEPSLRAWGLTYEGNVYEILKQYGDAIAACETAIKLAPRNALLYRNLANICIIVLELDRASKVLLEAEKLQPEHPFLPVRWAQLHVMEGDGQKALMQTERVIALPGVPAGELWLARSEALLLLGRRVEASRALETCIQKTTDPHSLNDYVDNLKRFQIAHPRVVGTDKLIEQLGQERQALVVRTVAGPSH